MNNPPFKQPEPSVLHWHSTSDLKFVGGRLHQLFRRDDGLTEWRQVPMEPPQPYFGAA